MSRKKQVQQWERGGGRSKKKLLFGQEKVGMKTNLLKELKAQSERKYREKVVVEHSMIRGSRKLNWKNDMK